MPLLSFIDWKSIHLTQENVYNGEIEKIRGAPWDFSHLRGSIVTLLKQNPHHDIYLFGGVESCAGSSHHQLGIQAPFINAILIPLNNSPASLVCYKNNQSGTEDINSFDDLEYRWSQLDGASLDNRVYFLQCDTDTELAPSRDTKAYYAHEYSPLYMITPSDMEIDHENRLRVEDIDITFIDGDGEEMVDRYDIRDDTLSECIDRIVEGNFDDLEVTDEARKKEYIRRVIMSTFEEYRIRKQAKIHSFFKEVEYGPNVIEGMSVIKMYPTNFPAATTGRLPNAYYDKLPVIVASHHKSLTQSGLFPTNIMEKKCLQQIDIGASPSSPLGKLYAILIVEFFESAGCLHIFKNELDSIFALIGCPRILQHVEQEQGFSFNIPNNCFNIPKLNAFVRSIMQTVVIKVKKLGRPPANVLDFIVHFLFECPDSSSEASLCSGSCSSDKERNLGTNAEFLRINPTDEEQLEICLGDDRSFTPICASVLTFYLSPEGILAMILNLLGQSDNAGRQLSVPPGSRDDLIDQEQPKVVNCWKECILMCPLLDDEDKVRVKRIIPDYEITPEKTCQLFETFIKTISIKAEKRNCHHIAMTSKEMMLGVFASGTRNHCILIDGSKGSLGEFADPVKEFGTKIRSKRSLQRLAVEKFDKVYTLRKYELSDKKRKKLQNSLNLPFVKGAAATWKIE